MTKSIIDRLQTIQISDHNNTLSSIQLTAFHFLVHDTFTAGSVINFCQFICDRQHLQSLGQHANGDVGTNLLHIMVHMSGPDIENVILYNGKASGKHCESKIHLIISNRNIHICSRRFTAFRRQKNCLFCGNFGLSQVLTII